MWKFGSVEVRKCGSVEVWKCGSVEVWNCGSMELWKYGSVEVWKCVTVELWKCGSVGVVNRIRLIIFYAWFSSLNFRKFMKIILFDSPLAPWVLTRQFRLRP